MRIADPNRWLELDFSTSRRDPGLAGRNAAECSTSIVYDRGVSASAPIITFTSDFGAREYYVGAVKGVILSHCPEAIVVDISHEVASHDLLEAAFTIASAFSTFPPGTIHLVVVDPEVGSNRRGIVAISEKHTFVAPDNGVLSMALDLQPAGRVYSIEADHYFRQPVSPTFHGRDIFAPVAGQLARGIDGSKFGPLIEDPVRLGLPPVRRQGTWAVEGVVVHIDKFGNVITSITPADLGKLFLEAVRPRAFELGETRIETLCHYYAEGSESPVMALEGSSGYYEIAAWKKSAAQFLGARRGIKVTVEVEPAL